VTAEIHPVEPAVPATKDTPGSPEVRLTDKYLADTRAELATAPEDGPELREFMSRYDGTLFGSQLGLLELHLAHARMTGAILDVYLTLRAGDMLLQGLPMAETPRVRKERVKFRQAVAACLLPAEGRVPERGPGDAGAGPVPAPPWLARSMVCVMTDGGPGTAGDFVVAAGTDSRGSRREPLEKALRWLLHEFHPLRHELSEEKFRKLEDGWIVDCEPYLSADIAPTSVFVHRGLMFARLDRAFPGLFGPEQLEDVLGCSGHFKTSVRFDRHVSEKAPAMDTVQGSARLLGRRFGTGRAAPAAEMRDRNFASHVFFLALSMGRRDAIVCRTDFCRADPGTLPEPGTSVPIVGSLRGYARFLEACGFSLGGDLREALRRFLAYGTPRPGLLLRTLGSVTDETDLDAEIDSDTCFELSASAARQAERSAGMIGAKGRRDHTDFIEDYARKLTGIGFQGGVEGTRGTANHVSCGGNACGMRLLAASESLHAVQEARRGALLETASALECLAIWHPEAFRVMERCRGLAGPARGDGDGGFVSRRSVAGVARVNESWDADPRLYRPGDLFRAAVRLQADVPPKKKVPEALLRCLADGAHALRGGPGSGGKLDSQLVLDNARADRGQARRRAAQAHLRLPPAPLPQPGITRVRQVPHPGSQLLVRGDRKARRPAPHEDPDPDPGPAVRPRRLPVGVGVGGHVHRPVRRGGARRQGGEPGRPARPPARGGLAR
jgi:hypothetical protein